MFSRIWGLAKSTIILPSASLGLSLALSLLSEIKFLTNGIVAIDSNKLSATYLGKF